MLYAPLDLHEVTLIGSVFHTLAYGRHAHSFCNHIEYLDGRIIISIIVIVTIIICVIYYYFYYYCYYYYYYQVHDVLWK